MKWVVYFLRVRDGSLYCGITNDYAKRLRTHQARKGSKYVAHRLPILEGKVLMEFDGANARSDAAVLEAHIKRLPKIEKEKWMMSYEPGQRYLLMLASDEY